MKIWTMRAARRYHSAWLVRQPFREWARGALLPRVCIGKLCRVLGGVW